MGTSKDTRRLGYRQLIYNIENGKFFYELPGDQYQELTNIDELPPLGNDWQNIGPDIYYPGNVFIGGLPPNSNIILRSNGDAEFKGDVTLNCVTFDDGSTQCSAFNGDYGVISINNNKGNVILTTGDLPNTAGFITLADIPEGSASVTSVNGQIGTVVLDIPENTSDLNNDSGFITLADVPGGGGGGAVDSVNGQTGDVVIDTFSGDYTDLTNKPAIPTNNNQLVNGASYITSAQAPVQPGDLFSGDYDDLTNKPVIPTNNNQLTNGAGYITASDIPSTSTPNLQNVTNQGNNTTNDITLGTDKITLDAGNGSATFAGDVQVGGDAGDSARQAGVYQFKDGAIAIAGPSAQNLWNGYTAGTKTNTNNIKADGNASFASNVQVGTTTASSSDPGGYIYATRYVDASNVGSAALCAEDGGELYGLRLINRAGAVASSTASIKMDGSASFAGNIDLTDSTVDLYSQTTNSASKTFQLFSDIGGTKEEQVFITANGSATFAGTVTAANFNIDSLQVLP